MMTKRTRTASEFLLTQSSKVTALSVKNAVEESLPQASKKSRSSTSGSKVEKFDSNYDPLAIESLRQLVADEGGLKSAEKVAAPQSLTNFQRRVYALTRRIPAGRVATYKSMAFSLDCPKAYRAVGNALRCNPFAPWVPCHRVLAADGAIGGFAGATAASSNLIKKKRHMLENEGIVFEKSSTKNELKKDEEYRSKVMLDYVNADGIDSLLSDEQLLKRH